MQSEMKWLARVLPDWGFKAREDGKIACYPPGKADATQFAILSCHAVIVEDVRGGWLVSGLVPQLHVLTEEN